MKLSASTKDFMNAVDRISSLPGAAPGIPATQAIRFEADTEGLQFTRFSSEAKVSVLLESVKIEDSEGTFSVSHDGLSRLVGQMPGKELTLENDGKFLRFTSGRATGKLAIIMESEAEPPEPDFETEHIRLPIEQLVQAFQYVSYAASKDETQKGMTGICVRMVRGRIALAATDNRRIHVHLFDGEMPVDCVMSAASVEAIRKNFGEHAGACTFAIGENMTTIISPDSEMNMALMSDGFPNIEPMLFPDESSIKSKVVLARSEFVEFVKRASVIAGESSIQFDIAEDELTITAANQRDSEMGFKMPCTATKAESFLCAGSYIFTALSMFSEHEEIELCLYAQTVIVRESNRIAVFALRNK